MAQDDSFFGLDFNALADGLADEFGRMMGGLKGRAPFDPGDFRGTNAPLAGFDFGRQGTGLEGLWGNLGGASFGDWGQIGGQEPIPDTFGPFGAIARADAAAQAKRNAANPARPASPYQHGGAGGPSSGMAPGVAQWADKTQAAFGDLGADMPDTMLAIMTNESGGKVDAYNPAAPGGAWGLFQLVGQIATFDVDAQFAAARKLAQDKLAGIAASYARNGLNPDARTRARDFALAWAGHFDYASGTPNPSSRDIGSGQTADQLSAIFLANYDRIKAGRQQVASGGPLAANAQALIGTPYVAGGLRQHPNNPELGLDCSELTAYLWGKQGVSLPWNAQAQYNYTDRIAADQLQVGDLVFFHGTNPADPDYITHVGIYMGNGMMINAQDGGVMMAALTSPYWQEHLAGYGRVRQYR